MFCLGYLESGHAEILYPSRRNKQPTRELLYQPDLFSVRHGAVVRRLHHHGNPGQTGEQLGPGVHRHRPSPILLCPSRWLPSSFLASLRCSRAIAEPRTASTSSATSRRRRASRGHNPPRSCEPCPRTPALRRAHDLSEGVEGRAACVPAPTEFSTIGSATRPETSAYRRRKPRPLQTAREPVDALLLSVSAVAAGVDDDELHAERPRGDQLARQDLNRTLSQIDVRRGKVYQVLRVRDDGVEPEPASAGECRRVRPRRRHGPALGLETKIWTVSHPRSLAVSMVFARPPDVRRWRPILFVLSGMAQILAAGRRARCERYNHSDYEYL